MSSRFHSLLERLAAGLVRARWGMLAFVAIVTALLWVPSQRLKLDESIDSFYSPNDPFLVQYLSSRSAFGGDEFVLVAYRMDEPLGDNNRLPQKDLVALSEFSEKLSAVPGIDTDSTQDLERTLRSPNVKGVLRFALRGIEPAIVKLMRRVLIGDDNQTLCVILRLLPEEESGVPRAETFARIRELAAAHVPAAAVAGEPLQIHDMFQYVKQDGLVLGLASSAMLMLVILILFRNLRWVVLPIIIIHVALLWTKGLLYLSGLKLSMVSSMLTSLITIIGIVTTMHVTVNYRQFRLKYSREEAFRKTFVLLAIPMFWEALTTAIGFGALLVSAINPVRSFAIMVALGTMLVLLLDLLILPGGILIGGLAPDPGMLAAERKLSARLGNLARWTLSHTWAIVVFTAMISGLAIWGMLRVQVETNFSRNFRDKSPIVQSLNYFETTMGGVGSWEVSFNVPHELKEVDLVKVQKLANRLREIELDDGTKLTKVVALTDGLGLVTKVPRGVGLGALVRARDALLEEQQEILAAIQPEMEPSLYNAEQGRMRIMLRAREMQPAEVKLQLIEEVERVSREFYPEAETTGLYVLLAYLISSLLGDQLVSFALATAGVGLCVMAAFRSLRMGLVSLIPNTLPILLVIGGMGWVGIPINIGTAMIASVSIGLTVDFTIHYLTEYQEVRKAGKSHADAVVAAHEGTGLTLTLANIALVIGFSVLALSNFVPLIYFGLLVSIAMLGGLACNLLLLPVLLRIGTNPGPTPAPATT